MQKKQNADIKFLLNFATNLFGHDWFRISQTIGFVDPIVFPYYNVIRKTHMQQTRCYGFDSINTKNLFSALNIYFPMLYIFPKYCTSLLHKIDSDSNLCNYSSKV